MDPMTALLLLPGLIVGLTVHEFGHAWSASLLGDDFARRQGRVSLNPLRHLSPLGTLAIFLLPFGWGKPVVVNLYNFKHPRRDYLITSLAGPLANLLLVAVCLGLMQITRHPYAYGAFAEPWILGAHFLLLFVAMINMALAAFNLVPIPPLDGSKIWPCLIPAVKPAARPRTTLIWLAVLMIVIYGHGLRFVAQFAVGAIFVLFPMPDANPEEEGLRAGSKALHEGHLIEAENHFSEVLAIRPHSIPALGGRAEVRIAQSNWQGALDDINRAIAIRPTPHLFFVRARIYRAMGRKAEADAAAAHAQLEALKQSPHPNDGDP